MSHGWKRALVRMGMVPATIYLVVFAAYTYPALLRFRTHFYCDMGDGFQNVWNLWWVNKDVTELHRLPWSTHFLHWPYGTSLLGHTLNPFNGFLAIPLLRVFSLTETHNLIVTFSFVVAGLTAFLFAYDLSKSYVGSLLAGFIFTFSNYHFMHAQGHLQLVSLEWVPLFLLLWWRLISQPTKLHAGGAALVLFLVILCDYYYFFYCVLAGFLVLLWELGRSRAALLRRRAGWAALGLFVLLAMATSGVLVGALLLSNAADPLTGAHDPSVYALDLLSPFIYGAHWRFAEWTRSYWWTLPGGTNETSVYLGFSVIAMVAYCVWKRREAGVREVWLFVFLMSVFGAFALGPDFEVFGKEFPKVWMPYRFLARVVPPLRLSGCPVRMMVMVTLFAAVLAGAGFELLCRKSRKGLIAAAIVGAALAVEYLPKPIPLSKPPIPGYVRILRAEANSQGVLDSISPPSLAMYYQTLYDKPLAFGFLARLPTSVVEKDGGLEKEIREGKFADLWRTYRIRYWATQSAPPRFEAMPGVRVLWRDRNEWLFDLSGLPPGDQK